MEIPNLANQPTVPPTLPPSNSNLTITIIIVAISLTIGFWLSRFNPLDSKSKTAANQVKIVNSTDSISQASELKVNTVYGNKDATCVDKATGSIEKGSINGEGTHILVRPGGADQRASLTSSAVDLDLFVGKKVEITGQTNSSKKTGWLLDVCSIKITE